MKVSLPIFYKNEDSELNEIIGNDIPYEEYDKKDIVFYNINAISPYFSKIDNKEYSCIHSNSSEFICPLPIKETEKLIDYYLLKTTKKYE